MLTFTDKHDEHGGQVAVETAPIARGRLSAEDECQLARAWRSERDVEARERLVTANLGLVVSIAQRYRNSGVPLDELIAEGNLGLLSAVDGFDPECGSRFSTYAAYWIRQGISRAFASNSPRGRLNGRDRRDLGMYERATRTHYARTGELPTDAEAARELGWPVERVAACRTMHLSHARPCSLDQRRTDNPTPVIQPASLAMPRLEDKSDAGAEVDTLLRDLSPFERSAIELRFGLHGAEPLSVDTIAHSLDRTRRETREALRLAMAKLTRSGKASRAAAGRAARATRLPFAAAAMGEEADFFE